MARYIDANLAKAQFTSNFESLYDKPTIWAFIDDVPTADVQKVKHGRWIFDCERQMHDGWIYRQYHCTECGFQMIGGIHNFCPNCGAKMDLEGGMKE